jgi:hypothetical protein
VLLLDVPVFGTFASGWLDPTGTAKHAGAKAQKHNVRGIACNMQPSAAAVAAAATFQVSKSESSSINGGG